MKIPLNWLKAYVKLPKDLNLLTDKLTLAGHMLDKIERIDGETVIDLELRGNRADCYSILGIAREVEALFGFPVKSPPLYSKLKQTPQLKECQIKIKSAKVKRAMAVVIKKVKITTSPPWLQKRLKAYGLSSINNLVDLTNYVMVETGEPMHAFDLALAAPEITIRMAKKNEEMITFEGAKIKTTPDDLVWAKNKQLLSIAGAIGSKNHSILPTTKNILVEAANYHQANIRRTCRRHNLMTEAGIRHEKNLDSNLVDQAIKRFCYLVKANNWGGIEPFFFDYYPQVQKETIINLSYSNLEALGGVKIKPKTVKKISQALKFKIKKETTQGLELSIPTYRTDIKQEADLIEEILRIYGYDQIPAKILSLEIPAITTPPRIKQEEKIKKILIGLGFDEIISTSFVSEKYKIFNFPIDEPDFLPVTITNPPSADFKEMQLSLLPNLLEISQKLIDRGGQRAQFFEVGKVYYQKNQKFLEKRKLGLSFWQPDKNKKNFLIFKGQLEAFFKSLNFEEIIFKENQDELFAEFAFDIFLKKKKLASGGLVDSKVFFAQIDLEKILKLERTGSIQLWPKFPARSEDLTFVLMPKTRVGELIQMIQKTSPLIKKVEMIDAYQKTRTFRLVYQSLKKTLTSQEVEKIRKKVIEKAAKKFGAKLKEKV